MIKLLGRLSALGALALPQGYRDSLFSLRDPDHTKEAKYSERNWNLIVLQAALQALAALQGKRIKITPFAFHDRSCNKGTTLEHFLFCCRPSLKGHGFSRADKRQ
jgi:hypothetical protein